MLAAAIAQVPARMRRKQLVRIDGAGASHELITYLLSLATPRRTVLFTCGWMITGADELAIANLPASAWQPGLDLQFPSSVRSGNCPGCAFCYSRNASRATS